MYRAEVPDIRARELLTVVTLAEYGSFVAAAAHLKTSQPALTRTVKRVERVLGIVLFARNTRRVEITPAGREFVAVAERVLDDLQLTFRNLGEVTREQRGRVTVSTFSAYAVHSLPPIIRAYRETRPLVEVRIREGRQSDIVEEVRSGSSDFGVGFINDVPDIMDSGLLKKESIYALIPTSHPLAARRKPRVQLADLKDEMIVCGPGETFLRRLIDGTAAACGFSLKYAVTVDRMLSALHYVQEGVGIGILPEGCLPSFQWGEGFHAAQIGDPGLTLSVGVITLRGRYLPPAAAGLLSLVRATAARKKPIAATV